MIKSSAQHLRSHQNNQLWMSNSKHYPEGKCKILTKINMTTTNKLSGVFTFNSIPFEISLVPKIAKDLTTTELHSINKSTTYHSINKSTQQQEHHSSSQDWINPFQYKQAHTQMQKKIKCNKDRKWPPTARLAVKRRGQRNL